MRRALFTLLFGLSGCAFNSIDSCIDGDTGASCTPVITNLQAAVEKSEGNKVEVTPKAAVEPPIDRKAEYQAMDKELLKDEYRRISPQASVPTHLESTKVRVRIYPYSDGERFYDVRDIYVLIQKPGWNRGTYVYLPNSSTVSLAELPKSVLPEKLYVTPDKLNIRTGASLLFEVEGVLEYRDEVIPVSERSNGWIEIVHESEKKSVKGWAQRGNFSEVKPPPPRVRLQDDRRAKGWVQQGHFPEVE
jgi:uncharacterized protein YgiM (DUF1202 family)